MKSQLHLQRAGNVKDTTVVTLTYEFTRDGKQLLTTEIKSTMFGMPTPPTIIKKEFNYKVLNEKEIESTSPAVTLRFNITINGDELNMANIKDSTGKALIYKKVM